MTRVNVRRNSAVAAIALSAVIALVAACGPPPGSGTSFTFRATNVTAVDQTEFVNFANTHDEPYLINVWFRVKIGVANSAQTGVVSTRSASPEPSVCATSNQGSSWLGYCASGTQSHNLTGAQQGTVSFPGVKRFDVLDLANSNNKLEVMGVWTWAMEEDLIGNPAPGPIADILKDVLNSTVASGSVPSNPNFIGQLIIDNLGSAIAAGGAALANAFTNFTFGAGDDLLGSRMYVFVGARGSLSNIINSASLDLSGFNLGVQTAGIPDVLGVTLRATGSHTYSDQQFNACCDGWMGGSADHRYSFTTG